ncbi:MAG TPA: prolipoprotein diacylglyceryl transferase [Candidatus Binataceae bacterium]|jgi:phosphatidylglycerol:prolipoprotein diacylglycerol transferase
MLPVLFHLGPITIYSYGLMMALAFLAGEWIVSSEFRRKGYEAERASTLVLWVALAGIVSARLYYIADHWGEFVENPRALIFTGAGFVYYGGFIGGVAASYIFARRFRIPWLKIADIGVTALVLGHAIGRIGCLVSGDGDWGVITNLPWAMRFPNGIAGWNRETVRALDSHGTLVYAFAPGVPVPPNVGVHPTPIYEAILYFGVFLLLWALRKRNLIDGRLFYLYLILVGFIRLMVEFIRINARVMFGLSEAQLISLIMIAVGSLAWILTSVRREPLPAARTAQA